MICRLTTSTLHTRINFKSEYYVSLTSISLTIELREHIEKTLIACPTMIPDSLVKEMQNINFSSLTRLQPSTLQM